MCRASAECSDIPGDELGLMTKEECCLNDPDGYAFIEFGSETCTPCIGVFRRTIFCVCF